ncbi:hypothetical protein GCM10010191_65800 [Actinomadura vinacea]|uniref:Uncharacterized protein n=1 Tax=Actinomadura vinacea TaxID=115336 RepID=A0ABN3JVL5_9ACTN
MIAQAVAAEPESRTQIPRAERDRLVERSSRGTGHGWTRLIGLPGYGVTISKEPERRLAVVRAVCTREEIEEKNKECVGRPPPVLGKAGITWEAPLYPLDLDERTEIAGGVWTPQGKGPTCWQTRCRDHAHRALCPTALGLQRSSPPSTSAGRQKHRKKN